MSRDTDALVRELEEAGWPVKEQVSEAVPLPFAVRAGALESVARKLAAGSSDLLAPILVRHASPEVRAKVLRELLEEAIGHGVQVVAQGAGPVVVFSGDLIDAIAPSPEASDG
jgi:hypothetical protein